MTDTISAGSIVLLQPNNVKAHLVGYASNGDAVLETSGGDFESFPPECIEPVTPIEPNKISDDARAIGQEIYEEMFQRLMNYKMDTMRCEDDEQRGYPLIDFLSSSRIVDTGKREIEMIVDDVANSEIDAIIQRALTAARIDERNKALEDAAKCVEDFDHPECEGGGRFADAIRAMKVQA